MKKIVKIVGIVFGVAALVLVISAVVAPPAEQPPVSGEPEPMVEGSPTSDEETPPPAPSPPEESPPAPIDWSLVKVTDVIKVPGTDIYVIYYEYPFLGGFFHEGSVSVDKDEYSPELVRQLIEEDIVKRLAEMEEEERMEQELGAA